MYQYKISVRQGIIPINDNCDYLTFAETDWSGEIFYMARWSGGICLWVKCLEQRGVANLAQVSDGFAIIYKSRDSKPAALEFYSLFDGACMYLVHTEFDTMSLYGVQYNGVQCNGGRVALLGHVDGLWNGKNLHVYDLKTGENLFDCSKLMKINFVKEFRLAKRGIYFYGSTDLDSSKAKYTLHFVQFWK